MYILDTSAIRGIRRQVLEDILCRHDVAISTISVFEIASHLHDSKNHESYLRIRGNFLKCELPRMKDPFCDSFERIGLSANITRRDDAVMLTRLLAIVKNHDSLASLNDAEIVNPKGMRVKCKDIGTLIADVLKDDEDQYLEQVARYAKKLKLNGPKNENVVLKPENFLACIVGFSNNLFEDPPRVAISAALYIGYVIHRLYRYINARPIGISEYNVDRNDCEDAYICLHLDIMSNNVLVTEDQGTLEAINRTMECLNALLPKKIESKCAISLAEFIEQTQS